MQGTIPAESSFEEKRAFSRHPMRLPIRFIYSEKRRFSAVDATMVNCSRSGMCFESETGLTEGANLHIRLVDDTGAMPAEIPGEMLAHVRWCRKLSRTDRRFHVGVAYYPAAGMWPDLPHETGTPS